MGDAPAPSGPPTSQTDSEVVRLRRERDLYRGLLELGHETALEPFLGEALRLTVEVTGARQGYLELYDDDDRAEPRWWIEKGFTHEDVRAVRQAISQGIIAEALASGETVVTPSALLDPRFRHRNSVRISRIEAVLCAPIGEDPPRGVLYLQGRESGGLFTDGDRECVEIVARHLAPPVDRLLAQHAARTGADPTRPIRATLRLDGVVGRSAALAACLRQVALAAPLGIDILITGESGSGKRQLARIVHDNGPRAGRPFVELDCAAVADGLLETELFGAVPGATAAATRRIEGKVAAAEGGTLVLHEIGELSLPVQAKLLQLLQSRRYTRVGSTRAERADISLIATSNGDLDRAVVDRRFREDLYYRLQVLPLRVPALSERRDDIPELVEFFAKSACERHSLRVVSMARSAVRAAEAAEWPGNVRQLGHAVESAVIRAVAAGANAVERQHLFADVADRSSDRGKLSFQEATRQFQTQLVRETLQDGGWNVQETARRLDLARSHVYNLIKAFGLTRDRG